MINAPAGTDTFTLADTVVPVSLRVRIGDVAPQGAYTFVIPSPGAGPIVDAEVSPAALAEARARWRGGTWTAVLSVVGITLLLCATPLLTLRRRARTTRTFVAASAGLVVAVVIARVVFWFAVSPLPDGRPLTSPLDLLLTAMALTAIVWVTLDSIERWRLVGWRRHRLMGTAEVAAWVVLAYTAAGIAVTAIAWMYERVLEQVSQTPLDLVQFSLLSLHPLNGERLALDFGLVLLHAGVIWSAVSVTRLPGVWRTRRAFAPRLAAAAWIAGVADRGGAGVVQGSGAADRAAPRRRRRRRCRFDRDVHAPAARAAGAPVRPARGVVPRPVGTRAGDVSLDARVHDRRQGAADRDPVRPAGGESAAGSAGRAVRDARRDRRASEPARAGRALEGRDRAHSRSRVRRVVGNRAANLPIDVSGGAVRRQWPAGEPIRAQPPGIHHRRSRAGRMRLGRAGRSAPVRVEPTPRPPRQPWDLRRPGTHRRGDRRERDAGLPDAPLHPGAESLPRVAPARPGEPRRRRRRPGRRVRRLRMEPGADLCLRYQCVVAAGSGVSAVGRIAGAVLGHDLTRSGDLPRVLHERPRRDLRAGLSGHHPVRPPDERGGADLPGRRPLPGSGPRGDAASTP